MISLPQVDLGENRAAGRLGCEVEHVGQRVHIPLCHQIE
jgi:hypothetical protein